MKTAETLINSKITIKVNDVEHRAFMEACKAEGKPAARVLRDYMRRYVARREKAQ